MANTSWLSALSGAFGGSQTIDPSPAVVFSATNVNLTNQYTYNSSGIAFAWCFQAMQSATLTNFYMYITAVTGGGPSSGTVNYEVRAANAGNNLPGGTSIANGTIIATAAGWVNTTVASPPTLAAGEWYWIVVGGDSTASGSLFATFRASSSIGTPRIATHLGVVSTTGGFSSGNTGVVLPYGAWQVGGTWYGGNVLDSMAAITSGTYERGLQFQVPAACTLVGVSDRGTNSCLSITGAPTFSLYSGSMPTAGSGQLMTFTLPLFTSTGTPTPTSLMFPTAKWVDLVPGVTYTLTFKPPTINSTPYKVSTASTSSLPTVVKNACYPLGGSLAWVDSSSGSFVVDTNNAVPALAPLLVPGGAVSGGGGRRTNRMAMEIKQSTSTTPLRFLMVSSTDGSTPVTGLGSTPVVTLCKANGSSFSVAAGAVSELGGGKYQVAGNTTDTNTLGVLSLHATGTGAAPYDEDFLIVGYDPLSSTNLGLSALPTASPSVTGGLITAANNSNYVKGVVDNVVAAINGWTSVDVGIALANSRILSCSGSLSPSITNSRFSACYTTAIYNDALVFYNIASWFIWWDSTNALWTMSTAIGSRGTNYWISPTLVGTWTAGGSATGSPVFKSLGDPLDANFSNAKYDSNGFIYSNLQSVLGNVITVDGNNLLNVNAKDIGGQLAQLDANGLLKVDLEDIKGAASQGAAGYIGPDWSHLNAPGTTVSLSATTISSSQQVASVSGSVGSVTGSVGSVAGSIDGLSIPTAVEIRQEIDSNSTRLAELATTAQLNSAVTDIESAIAAQASNISINIPPAVAVASQDPATIAILRGDTLRVSLPPAGSIASRTKLTITAKQDLNDPDTQAIFQVVEGIGLVRSNGLSPTSPSGASLTVIDQTSGTITLVIEPAVTSTFAIQDLVWDLQVESPGGIVSPLSGIATVFADVTRAVT